MASPDRRRNGPDPAGTLVGSLLRTARASGCNGGLSIGAKPTDGGTAPAGRLTAEQASRVLAKVGDRTITLGDYAATLERMDQFDRLRYQSPERRKELSQEIIDVELLAQDARAEEARPAARDAAGDPPDSARCVLAEAQGRACPRPPTFPPKRFAPITMRTATIFASPSVVVSRTSS